MGLLAVVVAGSFFIFSHAFSASSDVVINEIGAYPTSTHEWIEIWNKGGEPVDLTGWTFWENNTRHGLAANEALDSIIAPGEYAVIAQKSEQFLLDHPGFAGSIFGSTWSSLSTSGEEIGLNDSNDTSVERFVYQAATQFSLERKDPLVADYSSNNWQQHPSGHTLGFVNSNYGAGVGDPPVETVTSTPSATTTPEAVSTDTIISSTTATSTPSSATGTLWGFIKINEFVPNPDSGSEWVELYNASSSTVDLAGGTLCDNRTSGSCTIAVLGETILPHGFVTVFFGSGRLNNDGDTIILKDASGSVVDVIRYSAGFVAAPEKNQAGARRNDGIDTDTDGDWVVTTQLTPGSSNVIISPVATVAAPSSSGGTAASGAGQTGGSVSDLSFFNSNITWASVSSSIIINELLPNPSGSDEEGEFIELKNISATPVPLAGWQLVIKDKTFSLSGMLDAGAFRAFLRSETGIVLPNTTTTEVRLYNTQHQIAESVMYTEAPNAQSFARSAGGTWQWTMSVTPGEENKVVLVEQNEIDNKKPVQPIWKTIVPTSGKPGVVLVFDASKSVDPRGGSLFVNWDFGDRSSLDGARVEHAFLQPGTYKVRLSATSSVGTIGVKDFVVRIVAQSRAPLSGVVISELFVDPTGADTEEFVEVFNGTTITTDISDYRLQTSEEDGFVVPPATMLPPQSFLVFYRLATRLDLVNGGGEVNLISASGTLVDAAVFPKAVSGKSFSRQGESWKWAVVPTPGRFALASEIVVEETAQKVLGTKIKATTKPKTKKVALAPVAVDFDDTEDLVSGRPVIARGVVTAVPGALGKQYFYLSTTEGGMQIYQSKKDFPPLEVGDVVEVTGKISVVQGVKRINIPNKSAVDILDTDGGLEPQKIILDDMFEENTGALVVVQGEITEITGSQMYVDDGKGEIAVYVRESTKINKKDFKVGQIVKVFGILEQSEKGWRLSPRTPEDMQVVGTVSDAPKAVAGEKIESSGSKKYAIVGVLGGAALVTVAFFKFRKRSLVQ